MHAIGIMPDHMHLAVSIPPSIWIAMFVGRVKGASANAANAARPAEASPFVWQAEYGVFSFTERNLPDVVAYVVNQRERHANQTTWLTFEEFES